MGGRIFYSKKNQILKKATVFSLLFLFIFNSAAMAAAAETIVADQVVESEVQIDIVDKSVEKEVKQEIKSEEKMNEAEEAGKIGKEEKEKKKNASEDSDDAAVRALSTPLEQSGSENQGLTGPLQNDFLQNRKLAQSNGALRYGHAINIPAGRNGLAPDISLAYSQFNKINNSLVGYGWELNSGGFIERSSRKGLDRLYNNSFFEFKSFLNGSQDTLLPISTSTLNQYGHGHYGKKNESDFSDFEYLGDSGWKMTDKFGRQYVFGSSPATRMDNSASSTQIFRWYLERIEDTDGNTIVYDYFKDENQVYPNTIKYTGNKNVPDNGIFEIVFNRISRADNILAYNFGFPIRTNYLIKEIVVKVLGEETKKYTLDYVVGDNNVRSMLSAITEQGRSSGAWSALPPTEFKYSKTTKTWQKNTLWDLPVSIKTIENKDNGVRLGDVNGDGRTDLVQSFSDVSNHKNIYLNDGVKSWRKDETRVAPYEFISYYADRLYDYGVQMVDVNSDFLIDFVQGKEGSGGEDNNDYYRATSINNGSTWVDSSAIWNFPVNIARAAGSFDYGTRFIDFNADGSLDVVRSYSEYLSGTINRKKEAYQNKAIIPGWQELGTDFNLPIAFNMDSYTVLDGNSGQLLDINGDGLEDIIQAIGYPQNIYKTYTNQGDSKGWILDSNYPSATIGFDVVSWQNSDCTQYTFPVYTDINADGLIDVTFTSLDNSNTIVSSSIYLGTGKGWTHSSSWALPIALTNQGACGKIDLGGRFIDLNSDGLPDIARVYDYIKYVYDPEQRVTYDVITPVKDTYLSTSEVPDLLTQIIEPNKGEVSIEYKSSHEYYDASNNPLNPKLPVVMQLVDKITYDAKNNSENSTANYEYYGGEYGREEASDPTTNEFLSFAKIKSTDAAGNYRLDYYHQGGGQDGAAIGEYNDSFAKKGRLYRTEIYDKDNNLYAKQIKKWEEASLGNGRSFVKMTQEIESAYDGNASRKDKAGTYSYDNSNGNLLQKYFWGEVLGNDNGTFTDTGTDSAISNYEYANNVSAHIFGLPAREQLSDYSANKIKETKYYYDNLSSGQVLKGNLTKQEDWKSGTSYIDTEKSYNPFGLVTQEKDPRDKAVNYTYDQYNLHIATSTNALAQAVHYYYDYASGKIKKTIDQSSRVFETVYDTFARPLFEYQPDLLNPNTAVLKTAYTYNDTSFPKSVKRTDYLDSANGVDTFAYFDGFERIIQERKEAEDANAYAVKDYFYNKTGQLKKESLPYFSDGIAISTATTSSTVFSEYAYDPLERITSVANAVGTTTNIYDDWKLSVIDANGNTKDLFKDAYGNLVQVNEHNGAETYATLYTYNLQNKLTKIQDALNNVRNFTYDGLGRQIKNEDLHASADTSFGSSTFIYDDSGNLLSKTDAKNQVVNFVYDNINRTLTEDYIGQAGIETSYGYDNCADGIGRLCAATTTDAIANYSYNALGLVKDETKKIGGVNYLTQYEYDRQGNQTLIKYPDNAQAKYEYNSGGQLEKTGKKESGESVFADIISDYDYNAPGQITHQSAANNVDTNYIYDQNRLYRLINKKTEQTQDTISTTTATFYSQIGDGYVYRNNASWSATHDATMGTGNLYLAGAAYGPMSYYASSTNSYFIFRDFLTFDTTSLPDTATITSATLSVYPWAKFNDDNDGDDFITVVQSFAVSTSSLNNSDYIRCGSDNGQPDRSWFTPQQEGVDLGARKDLTNISINQYFDLNLNSAGKSWISKTDWTKLGLREGHDLKNSPLATSATNNINSGIWMRYGEYVSDSYDPKLTITYTKTELKKVLQDLSYEYDNVGNIVRITDNSSEQTKLLPYTTTLYSQIGDGYVYGNNISWTATHDAGMGNGNLYLAGAAYGPMSYYASSTNSYFIFRDFLNFETSALPDEAIIASATLSVYPWAKFNDDNDGDDFITVVQSFVATTSQLYNTDYIRCGSDNGLPDRSWLTPQQEGVDLNSRKDLTGITANQYFDLNLNATGTNWINKTDWTKLGLREGHDLKNTPIATSSTNNINSGIWMRYGEYVSNSYDPKLTINYFAPAPKKITEYSYDGLYRLTRASSTNSTLGGDFLQTITYNAIGNITNKSDVGNYVYASTNYANPHAATQINGTTQNYDNNGNLTSDGTWTHTWDYRNRIKQSSKTGTTVKYGYDQNDNRVFTSTNGQATSTVINQYYEKTGATSTKYIYANGQLIATIEGGSVYYNHQDHLSGSNVITNQYGTVAEYIDYYPFGAIRQDQKTSSFNEKKKFTGHYFDADTGLNYMMARYQNGRVGRFVSVDSVFLSVGDNEQIKEKTGLDLQAYLASPQALNAYAYANNNPIINKDNDGNNPVIAIVGTALVFAPQIANTLQQLNTPVGQWLANSIINDAKTITSPNSSSNERAMAAVGLGLMAVPEVKGVKMTAKLTSNEIGKAGEKFIQEKLGGGEIHKMFNTDLGKRFVDITTKKEIHEVKNAYISASSRILTQAKKDVIIQQNTGLKPVWNLLRGGTGNAVNSLKSLGVKVINYVKK